MDGSTRAAQQRGKTGAVGRMFKTARRTAAVVRLAVYVLAGAAVLLALAVLLKIAWTDFAGGGALDDEQRARLVRAEADLKIALEDSAAAAATFAGALARTAHRLLAWAVGDAGAIVN
jgi:hypothetical protein